MLRRSFSLANRLRFVAEKMKYPAFEKVPDVEDFHGEKIPDPYKWLEEPDSEKTKDFVNKQNEIFDEYRKTLTNRDQLLSKMREHYNYPKYGCPKKHGKYYYYSHNPGLLNQSIIYQLDSLDAEPRVFLDQNKLSEDGTSAIRMAAWNDDGTVYAFGQSDKGSDWVTIKFKTAEGELLKDEITKVRYSCLDWTKDGSGIFYNAYPSQEGVTDGTEVTGNENQLLFYHKMGTAQSEDIQIAAFPEDPKLMSGAEISDCGEYILLGIRRGCEPTNKLWIYKIKNGEIPRTENGILPYEKIIDTFDAKYDYLTNNGTEFFFATTKDAPRKKVISIDIETKKTKEIIPQPETAKFECVAPVNKDYFIVEFLEDVKSAMYIYSMEGKQLCKVPIDIGTIGTISCKRKHAEIFFSFTSFLSPGQIFKLDISDPSNAKTELYRETVVPGFKSGDFVTEQVFYQSKDGTKIPMFIVAKKGFEKNGKNPCLLYGYGGFDISITPSFSSIRLPWLNNFNGLYCIANIRGGGEYGEEWHSAAIKSKKQTSYDDFQAAAEYLTSQKYSSSDNICIMGGSNGGLLVGACLNQRPELFSAGVAAVGVMDLLRFHRYTIGHAWCSDFGCSDDKKDFEYLKKLSPTHNIPNTEKFPAVLVTTADHDDRVVPHHSLKYLATLQETCTDTNRVLLGRIDTKAGHGFGKSTEMVLEEYSDTFSFIAKETGASWSE